MEKENKIMEYCGKMIEKFNVFKTVQLVFILELYYLGMNSLLNIAINEGIAVNIPSVVTRYNNLVLNYFKEWNGFVLLLSIGLIICGVFLNFLNITPIIKHYMIIIQYSSSGIFIGLWLLFIYFTYIAYLYLDYFFILYIPLMCGISNGIKILLKYINENIEDINILWN